MAENLWAVCIRAAFDVGITIFSTLGGYADPLAELFPGEALKGARREAVEMHQGLFPNWSRPKDQNFPEESAGVDRRSFRRLRTDYVNVYQAHRGDGQDPLHETMET